MSEQMIKNIEVFLKKMIEHDVTKYKLASLTGIARPSVYNYLNGKTEIPASICKVFADAIEEEAVVAFPELRIMGPELTDVADGDYKPEELKDKVKRPAPNPTGNKPITINDMMAGSATLVPGDKFLLKVRVVENHLGRETDALSVQNETQVIVKTGIKTENLDMERLFVKGLKKHILENECHVLHNPFTIDSELCIAIYIHGQPLMICRGMEIAQLIFV